jgi:di/tricarboxylate transporter
VVSEGIDASGLTGWAGQVLVDKSGAGHVRLLVTVCATSAAAAALITPNGAVATLLPIAMVLAARTDRAPSRLLMPLTFAGAAGALLTLTGSPVNVIVSETAQDATGRGFGYFSFAAVGVPLVVGTIALSAFLAPRVLPVRVSVLAPPDLSGYADVLAAQYDLDRGFYRLRIRARSPLIGVTTESIDLSNYPGVAITAAQRSTPNPQLHENDILIITGPSRQISHLALTHKLAIAMRPAIAPDGALVTSEMGVAEVVIPPRSPLVGQSVFPGMQRSSDLVILAIRHLGRDPGPGHTVLTDGDALIVHGAWPAIEQLVNDRDVLLVDSPDLIRRQAAPLDGRAIRAGCVLTGMIILLALGITPPAVAALLAAIAMVVLRVITPPQAIRAISWEIVILIGGLIPLSVALQHTGAAEQIARVLVDVVGTNPYLLLLGLFILTAALGQIISNTATVLIVAPIAVVAAQTAEVSVRPLLMLVAVAGAASFLTPIATASNMMVMEPGGYRFGDYWKLGLPLVAVWLAVALAIIPLVWPF